MSADHQHRSRSNANEGKPRLFGIVPAAGLFFVAAAAMYSSLSWPFSVVSPWGRRYSSPLLVVQEDDKWEAEEVDAEVLKDLDLEDEIKDFRNASNSVFENLLADYNIYSMLSLLPIPDIGGYGLFSPVPQLDESLLLKVPLDLCLVEYVDPMPDTSNPELPWDYRLAEKLLAAIGPDGPDLWRDYAELLPPARVLGHPLLLPPETLEILQHTVMMNAVRQKHEEYFAMYPADRPNVEDENAKWPPMRLWALVLVRSRAVEIRPGVHALVPFLDMANHTEHPNAGWQVQGDNLCLFSLEPLKSMDHVTICYHPGMDNRRTYMQYGFVTYGGNPNDRLPGMDKLKQAGIYWLSQPLLWKYLKSQDLEPDDPDDLPGMVVATIMSLPLQDSTIQPPSRELEVVQELRSALEAIAKREFVTTMEDDLEQADAALSGALDTETVALMALMYRIERKALFRTAIDLLLGYESFLLQHYPSNTSKTRPHPDFLRGSAVDTTSFIEQSP